MTFNNYTEMPIKNLSGTQLSAVYHDYLNFIQNPHHSTRILYPPLNKRCDSCDTFVEYSSTIIAINNP